MGDNKVQCSFCLKQHLESDRINGEDEGTTSNARNESMCPFCGSWSFKPVE